MPAHQKGFTLLELLIAISLTAILMTVLVVGINLITRDWERNNQVLDKKLDESLVLLQIEKAILGTFPYSYKETILSATKLFFNATETELNWASTVSPNRSSGLTLWHIKAQEEGGISLAITPAYPGSISTSEEKQAELQASDSRVDQTIYFKDYKVSFSYLIENKIKDKESKEWKKTLEDTDNELPLGVKIHFTQHDKNDDKDSNTYEMFAFIRAQPQKSSSGGFGGGENTGLMRRR
ncbi:MAG: prepilin-type N-terminal cleavage/methylation domain-containing protein [Gammaproteobacteria bacterium]|nr:prepilin-type N-terminal cleavage/methylation domain-containing protein [Gammaproteobacteria bacterium]